MMNLLLKRDSSKVLSAVGLESMLGIGPSAPLMKPLELAGYSRIPGNAIPARYFSERSTLRRKGVRI